MSDLSQGERQELIEAFNRLADRLDHKVDALGHVGNSSASANFNAGSAGIWIAVTCCLVMLAAGGVAALWMATEITETRAQLRELRAEQKSFRAYINAGYVKPQSNEAKKP